VKQQPLPTIIIDAMGGDFAPHEIVKGAVLGARLHNVAVELVGKETLIQRELSLYNTTGLQISVIHTDDIIEMGEAPAVALRKKKNASIALAARRVKEGHGQALVAAGSTGAAMTAALFNMGRLKGVDRPAIGVTLPRQGLPCLLIDGGANADSEPSLMIQFALMGQAFMQGVYGVESPSVGLLNIGTEEGKGNAFCKEAFELLKHNPLIHFCGNVEGRHLFLGGCDVAVSDGFVGNVAIKSAEGIVTLFGRLLKQAFGASIWGKVVGLLAKPILNKAKSHLDHEELGGALLLGVQGLCVIAHGGSSAKAIANAIKLAKKAIDGDVMTVMQRHVNELSLLSGSGAGAVPSSVSSLESVAVV
jgi:phosphate acyltransferase